MKTIYIIHRWDGTPDSDWYPWLKEALAAQGFEVNVLDMPNAETPVMGEWVDYINEAVPSPDEDTYFVGHSIGCQAIMRYLETFDSVKIGKALFVAGWFNLKNLENEDAEKIAEPWLKTPIDFGKVKNAAEYFKVIISDDDPYDCLDENARIFKEKLGASVSIEKGAGHFMGDEYPIILAEISDMLK